MVIASRRFRSNTSTVFILGAVAVSLLMAVTIIRYNTSAESQDPTSQSSAQTNVESVQTTDTSSGKQSADDQTQSQAGASSSITSTTTLDTATPSTQGSITVNGKTYAVPPSGEFHKTVTSKQGHTSIDISSRTSGYSQTDGTSSSNVNVFSQTYNGNQSTESGSQ